MQKIHFPMGIEYELPVNIGDIVMVSDKDGQDSVDHVCEIDVKWNPEKGPYISAMYGRHDYSFDNFKEIKEIMRKGSWEESHLVKHFSDLRGRYVLINDDGKQSLAKITGMGVHFRDWKGDMFKRYYETTSYDVELDGEDKTEWILLPEEMNERVEKWNKTK